MLKSYKRKIESSLASAFRKGGYDAALKLYRQNFQKKYDERVIAHDKLVELRMREIQKEQNKNK